jgi:signal transduction histidine kinase/ActR/RegA family two-component response regulator
MGLLPYFSSITDADRPAASSTVRAELMNQWHRHEPMVVIATLLASLAFLVAMWPNRPHEWLLTWIGIKWAVVVTHVVRVMRRRPYPAQPGSIARWERELMISTSLTGAIWGAVGVVFFTPDQVLIVLFIGFALFGVSASIVAALSAIWKAYPLFAILVMGPLVYSCVVAGGELYITLGVMCVLYTAANIFFSRTTYLALRSSVELRFTNVELISELQAEKARVEAADRAKTQFLAAASHDLRQPIHALGLFASTLNAIAAQHAPKLNKMLEVTGKLQQSVRGLGTLLNTLLDISKLDAGVINTSVRPIAVQRVLDSLELEFGEAARAKSIRLHIATTTLHAVSDPVLLRQILANLISNAIRYSCNRSASNQDSAVMVTVRRREENKLAISVRDNGIGIPTANHDTIFAEFVQLHNPQRDRELGLGLGLSIVRRTCALLGHSIAVRSREGVGSVFTVTLPRAARHDVAPGATTASEHEQEHTDACAIARAHDLPTSAATLRSTIILIDDDKEVLDAMRVLVTNWGYGVIAAHSAASAIDAIRESANAEVANAHCVISDYRLANSSTGAEAIRAVQAHLCREIPAAIITGDTSPDRIREALASGFEVLHKPLDAERLRHLLSTAAARMLERGA